jgi:hypothetical protein
LVSNDEKINQDTAFGHFYISFNDSQTNSTLNIKKLQKHEIRGSKLKLSPGSDRIELVNIVDYIDKWPIDRAFLSYERTTNLLYRNFYASEWSFKYIEILSGDHDQKIIVKLCPTKMFISGNLSEFLPC